MAYIRRWAEAEYRLAETIFKAVIFPELGNVAKRLL